MSGVIGGYDSSQVMIYNINVEKLLFILNNGSEIILNEVLHYQLPAVIGIFIAVKLDKKLQIKNQD